MRAHLSRTLALAATSASLLASPDTRASGAWFPSSTTRVPIGLNVGAAMGGGKSAGALLGGEVSVVHWTDGFWFGGYTDLLHDFARRSSRLGVGGEVGFWFTGVDAGFVHDLAAGTSGFRVRGLASLAIVTLYAGGGHLYGGGGSAGFAEVGALLKWPLFERSDGSPWRLGF